MRTYFVKLSTTVYALYTDIPHFERKIKVYDFAYFCSFFGFLVVELVVEFSTPLVERLTGYQRYPNIVNVNREAKGIPDTEPKGGNCNGLLPLLGGAFL